MRRPKRVAAVGLALLPAALAGCTSGHTQDTTPRIVYGTTTVTAIAPSHSIPYPLGPSRTLPFPTGPRNAAEETPRIGAENPGIPTIPPGVKDRLDNKKANARPN